MLRGDLVNFVSIVGLERYSSVSEPTKGILGLFAEVEKDVLVCRLVGPSWKVTTEREGCEKDGDAELEGVG